MDVGSARVVRLDQTQELQHLRHFDYMVYQLKCKNDYYSATNRSTGVVSSI